MSRQKNSWYNTSLEALTPEGVKFVLSPAGLPVRALAYAIDQLIQMILVIAIIITSAFLRYSIGDWFFLLIYFLVDWFYHVFFELTLRGQSPGKKIAGIRVVRSDGAPVDPGSSFIRNLMRFADTFLYLYFIALLSISVSKGFRRLGDWAGNTLVVYTQKPPMYLSNIAGFLSKYEPISPPLPLSPDEKQAILNFARRYPLLGESRANEIAGVYTPYLREGRSENIHKSNEENRDELSDAAYLLGIARSLMGETAP